MIKPTVGRVVWVHRTDATDRTQPEVGFVTYVHGDTCINVAGFNADGHHFQRTSVYLRQDDVPHSHEDLIGAWAEWMPYQKGQAAKTEASEAELAAAHAKVRSDRGR